MKDQYFGDRNDYFKFDLAIFLAEQLPGIQKFTFIPMLTADDSSTDGELVKYRQGAGRGDLHAFLQGKVKKRQRQVSQLREYFDANNLPVTYHPYRDSLDQEFTHEERETYFRDIPPKYLRDAVILVDPDNGLEPRTASARSFHKYIRFTEVQGLHERMNDGSILLLYQHLPRLHRKAFLYSLQTKLQERLKCPLPISLSDGLVAFAMISQTRSRQKELETALADYLRTDLTLYD